MVYYLAKWQWVKQTPDLNKKMPSPKGGNSNGIVGGSNGKPIKVQASAPALTYLTLVSSVGYKKRKNTCFFEIFYIILKAKNSAYR